MKQEKITTNSGQTIYTFICRKSDYLQKAFHITITHDFLLGRRGKWETVVKGPDISEDFGNREAGDIESICETLYQEMVNKQTSKPDYNKLKLEAYDTVLRQLYDEILYVNKIVKKTKSIKEPICRYMKSFKTYGVG